MIADLLIAALLSASAGTVCQADMAEMIASKGKPDIVQGKIAGGKENWIYKKANEKIEFSAVDYSCFYHIADYLAYRNEPDGFRGIVWGTDIRKIKNLKKIVRRDRNEIIYNRPGESMQIGGVRASNILYSFYKNKLLSVMIMINGLENCERFDDALRERHGYPMRSDDVQDRYFWDGELTTLMLSKNSIKPDCSLYMISREFEQRKITDQEVEAEKNASQGF